MDGNGMTHAAGVRVTNLQIIICLAQLIKASSSSN